MSHKYLAPEDTSKRDSSCKTIFLAGSIEMGKAENWQAMCETFLSGEYKYVTYNPRRESWDSSWTQSIDNPKFVEQVEWELDHLDECDIIVMYLDGNTMSPISLLELGLFASSGKMHLVCQDGFWRKGNVDVVCNRYNIPTYRSIEQLIKKLNEDLK